jgi:hypothetical protein
MLAAWAIGALFCVLLGWSSLVYARARERLVREWQGTAQKLGLHFEGDAERRTIEGHRRGVPVRAHFERTTQKVGKHTSVREQVALHAGGDGEIPRGLSVRRDTVGRSLTRLVSGQDEDIGDAGFDGFVELAQLDEYVCAALSQHARELLVELLRGGGELRDGVLTLEEEAGMEHGGAWLEQQIELFAQLGAELSVLPSTLHRRLAQNAVADPSAGVRLANLRYLAQPGLGSPLSLLEDTARALLTEPDVALRSLAARQLGAEGYPVLSTLAADRAQGTALRVEALEALGQADAPGLEPLLGELLSRPEEPELLIAVLTGVGTLSLTSLRGAVLRCTDIAHEGVRAAATRALARLVDSPAVQASTEQRLLQLLADTSDDVQRASAEALAAVGSVRAVEPLLGLTRGLGRSALRQSARAAITQIQTRLGDVEAGRLSLADPSLEGAVELASTSAAARVGDVSLADEAAGEVESAAADKPHTSA